MSPATPHARLPQRLDGQPGGRWAAGAAVVLLHAAAIAALLSHEPSRRALASAVPIFVEIVKPPEAARPKPEPPTEPPRPKPVAKRAVERALQPPPVLAAAESAPAAVVAPPTPPAPPAPVAVVAPPAPPAPATQPVTQPVFDADYLDNPSPPYPRVARRNGQQGRVVLRVLVNPRGGADEVQVRTSSGHERLDDAARDTVRRWRFVAARRGAEPVAAWVLIPISFRLEG